MMRRNTANAISNHAKPMQAALSQAIAVNQDIAHQHSQVETCTHVISEILIQHSSQ
jgi:hypothetical protein